MSKLTDRLREHAKRGDHPGYTWQTSREAAERIEALERALNDIREMIASCPDAPRDCDSLPSAILHRLHEVGS